MPKLRFATGLAVVGLAGGALAYPNGTPFYVTDLVPACAACHSVLDPATMPELPAERAAAEVAAQKHLSAVRAGAFPIYSELDEGQREALAAEIEGYDREARVELQLEPTVRAGRTVQARVSYRGGNGPVVGVLLVDRPLRYQARPAQALGWRILEARARTADGQSADRWFARRVEPRSADLNFVTVPAPRPPGAPAPSGTVTFTLRAPPEPGVYPLTAVLLYGTENTDRNAFLQRPSGRILFSAPVTVRVSE
ncbi:MAG: hypothetical protein Kow0092_23220 [Deferrisomatales bacterium]